MTALTHWWRREKLPELTEPGWKPTRELRMFKNGAAEVLHCEHTKELAFNWRVYVNYFDWRLVSYRWLSSHRLRFVVVPYVRVVPADTFSVKQVGDASLLPSAERFCYLGSESRKRRKARAQRQVARYHAVAVAVCEKALPLPLELIRMVLAPYLAWTELARHESTRFFPA